VAIRTNDFAGFEPTERVLSQGLQKLVLTQSRQVLKVGHHGSAYGTTPAFLVAVQPKTAIVSVGRHNMFGHPAPSTLENLRRFDAKVYRTDENGAVTIVTDGAAYSATPMLP
jgi:competence protein ComEC